MNTKILLPLLLISSSIQAESPIEPLPILLSPQFRITPIRNLAEAPSGNRDYNFKLIDFNDKGEMLMQHTIPRSRGTSPHSIVTANNGEVTQRFFGGRSIDVTALSNTGQWIGRGLGHSWILKSPQDTDAFPTLSIFNALDRDNPSIVSILENDSETAFKPLEINDIGAILGIVKSSSQEIISTGNQGGIPYLATKTSEGWVVNDMNASFILEGDTSFSHQLYYNDTNQIAGSSIKGNERHAFIASKTNGQWNTSALGSLGGNVSTVSGLNNSGQIVGASSLEGNESSHGFIATKIGNNWNMVDLGTLGGPNSKATDINNAGQIIGSSEVIGQNSSVAVLISNGQAYKLIDLVSDQLEGWSELSSAFKINNKGQIIGTGKYNNQSWNYLLDPISIEQVPPPICEMGLDPKIIREGEGTALWWWSDAVISAKINYGIGNVTVPSNYKWFYPTETTTFEMHAIGADGAITTCKTELIVTPSQPEPPVCEMGADPQVITAGEGTALWWWSDNVESAIINNGIDSVSTPSDYTWFFPKETATYTMTAQGDDGTTSTCSTTITVQ